ncbi:MAG TPA: cell division protein FtsZ, partial [Bacteroidia bacterium]|nr:cell division protein FtsZ [Bacteroidia bacterium]
VGIVTMPFLFEGKKRRQQAEEGLAEMKKYVDTLLVISNDKLREIYGNLKMSEAFGHADDVLTNAAKSIAEIISKHLHVNVDFNDVKTVMKDSGVAIMGTATASGERRAIRAVEQALNSPLLNDNNIRGARHVLLNIMSGSDDISMDEFGEITDYIQEASGYTAELITGYGIDSSLGGNVGVTIIATGFETNIPKGFEPPKQQEKVVSVLTSEIKTEEPAAPVNVTIQTSIEDVIKEEAPADTNEPFLVVRNTSESKAAEMIVEETSFESDNEETFIDSEITLVTKAGAEAPKEIEFEVSNISEETEQNEEIVENDFIVNEVEEQTDFSSEEEIKMEIEEISFTTETEMTIESKEISEISSEEAQKMEREERIRLAQERIKKLKDITLKLKSSEGLMELEKEPSFVRQNIKLDDTNFSTESNVSRFTLSEGEDKKTEIKSNNSYLHDNVD